MKNFIKNNIFKAITIIALVVVAILSNTVFSAYVNNTDSFQETIESLEAKEKTATAITLAADSVSILIAAIPSDTTTPIANKILDISSYLVIVVSALVLEKILVKSLTYFAVKYLIPIACIIICIGIAKSGGFLKMLGLKLLIFAFVVANIIPLGIKASDFVYDKNQENIIAVSKYADENAELGDLIVEEDEESSEAETEYTTQAEETTSTTQEENENSSWFDRFKSKISGDTNESEENNTETEDENKMSWFTNTKNKVKEKTTKAINAAKELLVKFVDSVAILILTTCVIPLGIILIVLWLLKYLFDISVPAEKGKSIFYKYRTAKKIKETKKTELPPPESN